MTIGFIGQGYIGKNYADDFENRGYDVIRYAIEEPYNSNGAKIKNCDIVFIAVPTPTTPKGFDSSIVESVLSFIGDGATAVIKSTILPGTTKRLQEEHKRINILYSPEFLSEVTAVEEAVHPFSNIVGIPFESDQYRSKAQQVLDVLPNASFSQICSSTEAEIIKYTHNISAYVHVVIFNMVYDLTCAMGYGWANIGKAIQADSLISNRYANPVHKSGRGAGGHCFIKDFSAFKEFYEKVAHDTYGSTILEAVEKKNIQLLAESKKDLDLLEGVYGRAKFSE